jgi:4-hydroxybenzoate polyprenyltransferase
LFIVILTLHEQYIYKCSHEFHRLSDTMESIKAYLDLTRIHFWFVWPLLFCSGLVLAFHNYGDFSWSLTAKAVLIAVLGFEAGFVLNDYVDRELDRKDVEFKLTHYWRPFKKRPLAAGLISPQRALLLFFVLVLLAALVTATLPYPHNLYVAVIGVYSYGMEYFYQMKKRDQNFPWAQLLGRTDFTLFPVAGYLVYGHVDNLALLYMVFFYPWVMAHLGVNDMADLRNDRVRGMKTVPVLYGVTGTVAWVTLFAGLHIISVPLFLQKVGLIAAAGVTGGVILLGTAVYYIVKEKTPEAGLKVLPLFHIALLLYTVSIIADYAFSFTG